MLTQVNPDANLDQCNAFKVECHAQLGKLVGNTWHLFSNVSEEDWEKFRDDFT